MLFIAMLTGFLVGGLEVVFHWQWFTPSWFLSLMIFLMLFFTFCEIDPKSLRPDKWHWMLLVFQIVVSLIIFYSLRSFDLTLAQGLMLCVLMPSAIAAPIIAAKLGGSVRTLTAFTLLSSASTAVLVPLIFPLMTDVDTPFLETFLVILRHISPILLLPFFLAWLLRIVYNQLEQRAALKDMRDIRPFRMPEFIAQMPFYLWAGTLTILMAKMMRDIANYDGSLLVLALMFGGSLLTCMLQFFVGKQIGEHYPSAPADEQAVRETRVSAGQGLGQKNTTLGIWMAATYLQPLSVLAPAAYIFWQNLFNAWQLWRVSRGKKV